MTVAGKSASEAALKASAVNCAVLPYMLRSLKSDEKAHSTEGAIFYAVRKV